MYVNSRSFLVAVALVSILGISKTSAEAQAPSAQCAELLAFSSKMGRPIDQKFINNEVCSAYQFLIERYTIGERSAACIKSKAEGITGLNPDFAVRLAKLLKDAPVYIGINSALRPRACQGSTNPESNHVYGCAVDLGYSQSSCDSAACQWILRNAPQEPYKIHIRMKYSREWNHVEPLDRESCRAGKAGDPSIPSPAPSAAFSQAVRQAFGLPTQQNQVSVDQPAFPSQPVSSSQSPISAFNEPQVAPGVSKQINTSVNTSGNSSTVADRLEELAFGPRPATSTTATSVPLVVSGANAAVLTGSQNPTTASTNSITGISNPVQQTFTSGDLSWQGESVSSSPVSGMTAILITLKSALMRLLQYLTPFGARGQMNVGGDVEMVE